MVCHIGNVLFYTDNLPFLFTSCHILSHFGLMFVKSECGLPTSFAEHWSDPSILGGRFKFLGAHVVHTALIMFWALCSRSHFVSKVLSFGRCMAHCDKAFWFYCSYLFMVQ